MAQKELGHKQPHESTIMLGRVFCITTLLLSTYKSCSDENLVGVQHGDRSTLLSFVRAEPRLKYFCKTKTRHNFICNNFFF